jgi:hypothetical protein
MVYIREISLGCLREPTWYGQLAIWDSPSLPKSPSIALSLTNKTLYQPHIFNNR